MPAFETLEQVNRYTNSSLKRPQARRPSSASLPTIRTSRAEASAQRLGRAQPAVISLGECLNLKWLPSYASTEYMYLLTKPFIHVFFFQNFWGVGAEALMDEPPLLPFYSVSQPTRSQSKFEELRIFVT
jgi:hypothetical protein